MKNSQRIIIEHIFHNTCNATEILILPHLKNLIYSQKNDSDQKF